MNGSETASAQRMLNSVPSHHCSIQGLLRSQIRYCRWYLTPQCNATSSDNLNGNRIRYSDALYTFLSPCLCLFFLTLFSPLHGMPFLPGVEVKPQGCWGSSLSKHKKCLDSISLDFIMANSILYNGWLWRSFSPLPNYQDFNFEIILLYLEPLYIVLSILCVCIYIWSK